MYYAAFYYISPFLFYYYSYWYTIIDFLTNINWIWKNGVILLVSCQTLFSVLIIEISIERRQGLDKNLMAFNNVSTARC